MYPKDLNVRKFDLFQKCIPESNLCQIKYSVLLLVSTSVQEQARDWLQVQWPPRLKISAPQEPLTIVTY